MPKLLTPYEGRLLETIAIRNGQVQNLAYHQQRMLHSAGISWQGAESLLQSIPPLQPGIAYKLRLIYSRSEGIIEWSLTPYELKPITALKLIEIPPTFDYHLKYADRSAIDTLSEGLPPGVVPLFVQKGLLTDTSYTNICLRPSGKEGDLWVTPSTPLLRGTMRQSLLDSGTLAEKPIPVDALSTYTEIALINAMLPLGYCHLPTQQISRFRK